MMSASGAIFNFAAAVCVLHSTSNTTYALGNNAHNQWLAKVNTYGAFCLFATVAMGADLVLAILGLVGGGKGYPK